MCCFTSDYIRLILEEEESDYCKHAVLTWTQDEHISHYFSECKMLTAFSATNNDVLI